MADDKDLVALVDLLLDALGVVVDAEKDGKIDLNDVPLLMRLVPDLGPALSNLKAIPGEAKSLSSDQMTALATHVMTKLAIAEPHARAVVEASLNLGVSLLKLMEAIKTVPAPAVAAQAPSA